MPFLLILLAALWLPSLFGGPKLDVMVPMRDGVKLATTVYLPDGDGPWPTILTRTPYDKSRSVDADRWTPAGYARVWQDVRGQFKSEGKYNAFEGDIDDGYDTVEWVAAQPWSNKKVGMLAGPATGITANMAAMSGAPHLLCAFVTVASGSSYRYTQYPGGVFLKQMNEVWLAGRGVPPSKDPRPLFRMYDDRSRRLDMRTYFSKITVPMYNVGGWYDIFDQASVDDFAGLQEQGGPGARGNQKVLMGAFGHGQLSGDLKYPANSNDRNAGDQKRWFDQWLKGIDTGIMKEPPVRYYLMGDAMGNPTAGNKWLTAPAWPPKTTSTSLYLQAAGALGWQAPTDAAGSRAFTYDPKDPVPTVGGNNLNMEKGPMDQRKLAGRTDILRFQTEVLAEPVAIAGKVVADLWVGTDAEDTDFMVKLIDVYPNGYEALTLDQAFRLRYHEGFEKEARVERNKPYNIKVDLWSTAIVFDKGHRIAVHVTSSNAPRFEPHSNTWKPVASYDQAVKARNTVYFDGAHSSRMLLPVLRLEEGARSSNE